MEKRGKNKISISYRIFKIKWIYLDRPGAPHSPTIIESSINATSLIITWRKDSDFNYAPIRYTYVQYEDETSSTWMPYDSKEKADGQTTSMLIEKSGKSMIKLKKYFELISFSVWKLTVPIDFELRPKMIWVSVITVDQLIGFERRKPVRWEKKSETFDFQRKKILIFFVKFLLAPTRRVETEFVLSDEPCEVYIRLKVKQNDKKKRKILTLKFFLWGFFSVEQFDSIKSFN